MQKEKDMTVSDLITFWKGTNADYFNLVADGKIIPRYKKLREAGISVTSKVELIERKISFTVTLQNQCPFTVVLSPSNTLLDVKQYIEATQGIPVKQQSLVFSGRYRFSDRSTLIESKIKNNSKVELNLRKSENED